MGHVKPKGKGLRKRLLWTFAWSDNIPQGTCYLYIYIKRLVAVGCIALTTLKLPWGIGSNILKESPLFFFCPSSPPTPALILEQTDAFSSVSLFLRKILCLWVKRTWGPRFSFLPLVSQPPVILSGLHWSDAAKEEIKKEVLCWYRVTS